ncbi:MAG: hypothetical protein K0R67_3003 [Paenibacillus sp.]|jgi:hypothetical protein|nr:hypothetical protein [Paenibacillus sp.]
MTFRQYLYHYYEQANGPFRNLSSQTPEQAEGILNKLRAEQQVFAGRRSDQYLMIRRELEQQARDMFIEKGGKPTNSYPHYMTLGACDWLTSWYKQGRELQIEWNAFDEQSISFTYGDLFPTMRYQDDKPYRRQVYTKEEILGLIGQYGLPQEWNKDGAKGPERYIEVQIWDDSVLKPYMIY